MANYRNPALMNSLESGNGRPQVRKSIIDCPAALSARTIRCSASEIKFEKKKFSSSFHGLLNEFMPGEWDGYMTDKVVYMDLKLIVPIYNAWVERSRCLQGLNFLFPPYLHNAKEFILKPFSNILLIFANKIHNPLYFFLLYI